MHKKEELLATSFVRFFLEYEWFANVIDRLGDGPYSEKLSPWD